MTNGFVEEDFVKNNPKFLKIKWNGWDYTIGVIRDKDQLALWLQDDSLSIGDIIVEVKAIYKVGSKAVVPKCLRLITECRE